MGYAPRPVLQTDFGARDYKALDLSWLLSATSGLFSLLIYSVALQVPRGSSASLALTGECPEASMSWLIASLLKS